ncbi:MAG: hypothetical protein IPQ03_08385 [Bacteroidetes bacterium]|nr:hypothetical protein [Bacteroidota bacterium]
MPIVYNAELVIEGKTYRVMHCDYAFNQPITETGRPNGRVFGGLINLEVETSGDITFIQWMVEHHLTKRGELHFRSRRTGMREKSIEFEDAYVVNYFESYNDHDTNPMTERIVISALKMTITTYGDSPGTVMTINDWPV